VSYLAHQIVFQDYINAIHDGEKREYQLVKQIETQLPHWVMKPLVDALCLMKGLSLVASASVLSVTGDLWRLSSPTQFSGYTGLVPSEHSSGNKVKRHRITKTGNTELRRVLIQAAWCYRIPARATKQKESKFTATDKAIRDVAWIAQVRLCRRYRQLIAGGKLALVPCAAVARELATFIWELGQIVPPLAETETLMIYILAHTAKSRERWLYCTSALTEPEHQLEKKEPTKSCE
jgi:transposase